MDMTGEFRIPAPREAVWKALNDPEILKQSHRRLRGAGEDLRHRVHRQGHGQGRAGQGALQRQGDARAISIRPTATRSPARVRAVRPASPRAAPRCASTPEGGGTSAELRRQCRDRRQAGADRRAADRRHRAQDGRTSSSPPSPAMSSPPRLPRAVASRDAAAAAPADAGRRRHASGSAPASDGVRSLAGLPPWVWVGGADCHRHRSAALYFGSIGSRDSKKSAPSSRSAVDPTAIRRTLRFLRIRSGKTVAGAAPQAGREDGMPTVTMTVNGKRRPARSRAARCWCSSCASKLGLTGTHVGCDTSQCGACVVHVDGESVKSCTMLARAGRRRRA